MANSSKSIYDELSERITSSERFTIYFDLVQNEILNTLNLGTKRKELSLPDVKFLLESASILALSSVDQNKQIAYSIVVLIYSQYKNFYETLKSIVELILIRLGNFPAYTLLQKATNSNNESNNGNLIFNFENTPLPLKLEVLAKEKLNHITIGNEKKYLTDFQKELFDKLQDTSDLSFAAPTSAGKSFLLALFVIDQLKTHQKLYVVYIVPTKALINQVKQDFKRHLKEFELSDVKILSSTLSFEFEELSGLDGTSQYILILTQERLSYLLKKKEIDFKIDILIVDEAQKINDGNRGVVLERAILNAIKENSAAKIIFSSPLASNPDFFKKFRGSVEPTKTNYSPVHQNLIMISTKKRQTFLSLLFGNQVKTLLKDSELVEDCPMSDKAKTAYLAFHLGKGASNILYANGAADTETLATALCNYLPDVQHPMLNEFISFIKENIHADYSLTDCLKKGVAFHYSTMPREIKERIESLFSNEEVPLRYLCCTSTLLEGMNLPARNVFINKPTKGRNKNMEKFDFWNLAGRAGRLLKDFYGNIYCIDIEKWPGYKPERSSENYLIESATEESLVDKSLDLSKYLENHREPFPVKERELLEQTASTFVLNFLGDGKDTVHKFIEERKLEGINQEHVKKISISIQAIVSTNLLPKDILEKNAGIDPRLQNDLYKHFLSQFYITLLPKHPASGKEFYNSLLAIYGIIDKIFLYESELKMLGRYAVLSSQWINEYSLGYLIQNDIDYLKKVGKFKTVNHSVRRVVDIIDHTLTYKFAKYLKCYNDILEYHLEELKVDEKPINLSPFLELGANNPTTLSLLSFGVSRTTAIRLRDLIANRNLDRSQCRQWLDANYKKIKDRLSAIYQEDFETNYE